MFIFIFIFIFILVSITRPYISYFSNGTIHYIYTIPKFITARSAKHNSNYKVGYKQTNNY